MSRPVCYLNPLKSNAKAVLEAFAAGSGAEIVTDLKLRPGRPAVLYGVDPATEPLYRQIVAEQHPHYYIDNGYFASKWQGGSYYRITRDRPQHDGAGVSDGERFAQLGKAIRPWQCNFAGHLLVVLQSDYWHQRHGHGSAAEFGELLRKKLAGRPVIVRGKPTVRAADPPLDQHLDGCFAVVTHTSNVAVDALLLGIPVFTLGQCAASSMGGDLKDVDAPYYPSDRKRWAQVLADNQWTIDEIRAGMAWRALA